VLLHANFVNFLAQTSRKLRERENDDSTIHDNCSSSSTELELEVPESVQAAEKAEHSRRYDLKPCFKYLYVNNEQNEIEIFLRTFVFDKTYKPFQLQSGMQ
jgi:hypothetical protein